MPATAAPFSENQAAPDEARSFHSERLAGLVAPLVLAGVVLTAVVVAGWTYRSFLDRSRSLWWGIGHDRHAHYLFGLNLALDVRQGNVFHLLRVLDGGRTYPPLNGFLEAVVLLAGGRDYRLAVLPSLAGWVGAAVLGFLLARRAVPQYGTCAGVVGDQLRSPKLQLR